MSCVISLHFLDFIVSHDLIFDLVLSKPINLFPVPSLAIVIAITKRTKSREKPNVKNEISIYECWRKELWDYRFCRTDKMATRKGGLSNQMNLANFDMGHLKEIYS